ncbi:MAG: DUF4923 family protein [Rikenellaceae bacterium]
MYKIIATTLLLVACLDLRAQSLMDLLKAMTSSSSTEETTVSTAPLTSTSLVGKWNYQELAVGLSDDSSLKGFAGDAVLSQVSGMISSVATNAGITSGIFTAKFNSNRTIDFVVNGEGGRKANGSYYINTQQSTILISIGEISDIEIGALSADVTLYDDGSVTLLFDADTLVAIADKIESITENSQYKTVRALVTKFDGLLLGFKLMINDQ